MITDAPRTDALMRPNGALATNILEHARKLERELTASQAEVRRLQELLEESFWIECPTKPHRPLTKPNSNHDQ